MSQAEEDLIGQIRYSRMAGASTFEPVREYRFHPVRRWRFDLAYPQVKLAIEIDGGVYVSGRHSRGAGAEADMEKHAAALLLGWRVLRVTPRMIRDGRALAWIEQLVGGRLVAAPDGSDGQEPRRAGVGEEPSQLSGAGTQLALGDVGGAGQAGRRVGPEA